MEYGEHTYQSFAISENVSLHYQVISVHACHGGSRKNELYEENTWVGPGTNKILQNSDDENIAKAPPNMQPKLWKHGILGAVLRW